MQVLNIYWLLIYQLNIATDIHHLVIPAKAGIQKLQRTVWIPALRSAAAGMTGLVAGLIFEKNK